jgi:hypothetical protein
VISSQGKAMYCNLFGQILIIGSNVSDSLVHSVHKQDTKVLYLNIV